MATPPVPLSQSQSSTSSSPDRRRPSIQLPGTSPRAIPIVSPRVVPVQRESPRAVPLPVPQRHGSFSVHSGSFHGGSFHGSSFRGGSMSSLSDLANVSPRMRTTGGPAAGGSSGNRTSGSFGGSTSLSNSFVLGPAATDDSDSWLETRAGAIAQEQAAILPGNTGLEEATDVLIKGDAQCVIAQSGDEYGLFDFADLNTVLLLVLSAATKETAEPLDERARDVVSRLKRGRRVSVRAVCDISGKNPCSVFPPDTTIARLFPLFASGVHRVVISSHPPKVLEASALLAHLTRLPPPLFQLCLADIDFPLHRLVSLPVNASVMDAMQVMSLNGLGALGVVTGETEWEGEPSSLVAVVTANDCSKLVVPSEGKQALGMGLGDMCKNVMAEQHGGRERGEERVPVHTITPGTTLLHAANMLLATSSSRVFLRTPPASSPPLSPVTSFERLTPPTSPELVTSFPGLPDPPRTHISSQYVISILDILSCLARAYQSKLPAADPTADDMLPDNMSKRRRRASSSAAFDGFQTWRWAGDPDPSPFSQ